jgi:hypothetical protein
MFFRLCSYQVFHSTPTFKLQRFLKKLQKIKEEEREEEQAHKKQEFIPRLHIFPRLFFVDFGDPVHQTHTTWWARDCKRVRIE